MLRILIPALTLAACAPMATTPAGPPPAAEAVSEIAYETAPCFGTCPVYRVTVRNDGRPGVFEGQRFTKVVGQREFALQPAQFANFALALAPARSANQADYEQGGANCKQVATDMPSVTVTFREGAATPQTFRYYYGCRGPENAAFAESLRRAPDALPIAAFIGKR